MSVFVYIFWVVTLLDLVSRNQRFGETCLVRFQPWRWLSICKSTRRHNPEEHWHFHRREKVKFLVIPIEVTFFITLFKASVNTLKLIVLTMFLLPDSITVPVALWIYERRYESNASSFFSKYIIPTTQFTWMFHTSFAIMRLFFHRLRHFHYTFSNLDFGAHRKRYKETSNKLQQRIRTVRANRNTIDVLLLHDNARPHTNLRAREAVAKMVWTVRFPSCSHPSSTTCLSL
jgi:hypothetical protein